MTHAACDLSGGKKDWGIICLSHWTALTFEHHVETVQHAQSDSDAAVFAFFCARGTHICLPTQIGWVVHEFPFGMPVPVCHVAQNTQTVAKLLVT